MSLQQDDEAELHAAALAAVTLLLEQEAATAPPPPPRSAGRWRAAMRLAAHGPLALQQAERAGWHTLERLRRAAQAERGTFGR